MSETNETSKFAALEDHRPLADSELDAVIGGNSVTNAIDSIAKAATVGTAKDAPTTAVDDAWAVYGNLLHAWGY